MSAFTQPEIRLPAEPGAARIATVGPDDQPHVIPVTFWFNADEDAIDVGGVNFGAGKKWRDARCNPRVTFLLDDSTGRSARAIEVRGTADLHETGGNEINPRFPNFAPQFFRIRPARIVSWGLEAPEGGGSGFRPYSRAVG